MKCFYLSVLVAIFSYFQSKNNISKKDLKGIWTTFDAPNSVFEIKENTVYYTEQSKNYSYKLSKNIIQINYSKTEIFTAQVSFIKDTLVFTTKDNTVSKYWKFNN